jgi:hypothetical protein
MLRAADCWEAAYRLQRLQRDSLQPHWPHCPLDLYGSRHTGRRPVPAHGSQARRMYAGRPETRTRAGGPRGSQHMDAGAHCSQGGERPPAPRSHQRGERPPAPRSHERIDAGALDALTLKPIRRRTASQSVTNRRLTGRPETPHAYSRRKEADGDRNVGLSTRSLCHQYLCYQAEHWQHRYWRHKESPAS